MGSFNFSGLGGSGSSNYSYLVDQLSIKENQLASDGKLSPGDYAILTKMARTAFANPGLTGSQRSQLAVKISEYNKNSASSTLSDQNDVAKLNREVQDEMTQGSMLYANNPQSFLQRKADVLASKLGQLKDSIDSLDQAGSDSTTQTNEFASALSDYQDAQQALDIVKNAPQTNADGSPATSDYAAYIKTNSKGEITDVDVSRYGSKTGYAEVKATYGGIPIYGKINGKDNGQNVFRLGSQVFTAPDAYIPDVNNPGASKSVPLTLQSGQSKLGGTGISEDHANAPYVAADLAHITSQSYIPDNGFAKGSSGAVYRKGMDGKYEKWVGTDPSQIPGYNDNNTITLPLSMEKGIVPMVAVTHDGMAQPQNPVPQSLAPSTAAAPSSTPAAAAPQQSATPPAAVSKTQAPVSRSPVGIGGIANQAMEAGKSFLGQLFGGSGQ